MNWLRLLSNSWPGWYVAFRACSNVSLNLSITGLFSSYARSSGLSSPPFLFLLFCLLTFTCDLFHLILLHSAVADGRFSTKAKPIEGMTEHFFQKSFPPLILCQLRRCLA